MSDQIVAIETSYAGCRFRSRLEARWAVFFSHLGITWEYEPEAFPTSVGNYLPDFRIRVPDDSYPYWFEVKPPNAGHDDRHRALCVETATPFIVARGMPRDYGDQMQGPRSALTAMLWGDRLDGAQRPAGDTRPTTHPCAFIGRFQGSQDPTTRAWYPGHWDQWDSIHKARHWYDDARGDVHVALHNPDQVVPYNCLDVDAAYAAARSARFGS